METYTLFRSIVEPCGINKVITKELNESAMSIKDSKTDTLKEENVNKRTKWKCHEYQGLPKRKSSTSLKQAVRYWNIRKQIRTIYKKK